MAKPPCLAIRARQGIGPQAFRCLVGVLAAVALGGCGTPLPVAPAGPSGGGADDGAWHEVLLPGKTATEYTWGQFDGRRAMIARSDGSASMMRRKVFVPSDRLGELRFSWQVGEAVAGAHVGDADTEDASARLLLAFGGDVSSLPARTRMMFELAHALTGEAPPYATLMYVWDNKAPVGTVIVNPRSDRVRKIVVDSGPAEPKRWREHRRNLAADFRLAYGEDPGPLLAIGIMTDSDNTRSRARAWYGPIELD